MKIKILIIKTFMLLMYLPVSADMMYTAEVTASSLNIRSIPSNEGRIIGSLYRGQKILVAPMSTEWVKTIIEGNETGYVSSIYLKMVNSDSIKELSSIDDGKKKCNFKLDNVDLSIIDVNMQCKDSIIMDGYESCSAKFDVVVDLYCDEIVDVDINCSAEFKYSTNDDFTPYMTTENNVGTVYANSGKGNAVIEVKLIPLAVSEPVVKVELVNGMCSVTATNYF
jgi:uncharacterized protein YgiM (DUF1202 family)